MTKTIHNFRIRVEDYINRRLLRDAINELKKKARELSLWDSIDKLEKIEQAYAYMLQYMIDGANDPERDKVYAGIVSDLYDVLDAVEFSMRKETETTQYFGLVRFYGTDKTQDRLEKLLFAFTKSLADNSLFSLLSSAPEDSVEKRREMENLQRDLFTAIWVTPRLSSAQAAAVNEFLANESISADSKIHILSAIMLSSMQRSDSRKLELLMWAYLNLSDVKAKAAALVSMLLYLWRWRERPLARKTQAMLEMVKDSDSWSSNLQIACIELIRTFDTARINKKIQDELLPEMMNLKPEIMSKIKDSKFDPSDMASLQENPEWEELLEKNGITDKLKEISEEQMQGADVMMSTFSHLKNFPFFSDISNWFLPFTVQHSAVANSCKLLGLMAEMVENATFFCDSDKYSFVFALDNVPAAQRELMTSQFKAQSDGIYEAMGEAMNATQPEFMRKSVNSYLQNIYRFFKLYRRHDEFYDPFSEGVNLVEVKALAKDFADEELLQVVAEFYFKYGYMSQAISVLERLEQLSAGDASRHQKMGYAYEKLRQYEKALEHYRRAELLDANSHWTLRRQAACYRAIGEKEKAQEYYERLESILPEDTSIALMLGYVLLEGEEYARALAQFYKVEFLDEKSHKAWRPIAWTLFLNGDLKGAQRYYDKILNENPTANDYLNMGHVALASGSTAEAVKHYGQSAKMMGGSALREAISNDAKHLQQAKVDIGNLPLIVDAVMYKTDNPASNA